MTVALVMSVSFSPDGESCEAEVDSIVCEDDWVVCGTCGDEVDSVVCEDGGIVSATARAMIAAAITIMTAKTFLVSDPPLTLPTARESWILRVRLSDF